MCLMPLSREPQAAIPFTLHDREGRVAVYYAANHDPVATGFDALPGLAIDLELTRGYPVMQAQIERYAGAGYRTLCGWIQLVTRHTRNAGDPPDQERRSVSVDVAPAMAPAQIPFAVFGALPAFLDAPCLNLGGSVALTWIADTFLTTLPLRSRDEEIRPLLGFRWGYREYDPSLQRAVELLPLVVTDGSAWEAHLTCLRQAYAGWRFGEATF